MPNPNLPNQAGYNTYVGARYVPVFSNVNNGIWTNTVEYEPLTIVTHNGNSFTSKTYVPIGIDINDTTYWALTGNYNAQIEAYREEVKNYANNSQTYFNLSNYITSFIKDKNILIIGASNEEPANSWAYKLKAKLTGIANVTINALGGRTLTGNNGGAAILVNNIDNYDVFILSTLRNDYWKNVPIASFNDASGYATINAALFSVYLSALGKDKKIFIPGMFYGPTAEDATNGTFKNNWKAYQINVADKCSRYGFNFIDAEKFAGIYMLPEIVTTDTRHFSEAAHESICNNMIISLLTNRNDNVKGFYRHNIATLFTPEENITLQKCLLGVGGGNVILTGEFTASQNLSANTTHKIGSFDEILNWELAYAETGLYGIVTKESERTNYSKAYLQEGTMSLFIYSENEFIANQVYRIKFIANLSEYILRMPT